MYRKKFFIVIVLAMALAVMTALAGCGAHTPSPDLAPHLIAAPDDEPVRPLSSKEKSALSQVALPLTADAHRDRVDELYRIVVDEHKQPEFMVGDPVKPVYDAAIALLDRYIRNAWHDGSENGELNIAHTLHDYLVDSVQYDFELYEKYQKGIDVGRDPAFDIEGVLLNKRAVCDGISKAYNFLCAIEDVECMRVTGRLAGVLHAWNKVRVGGTWYNVDVTSDAANYIVNGGEYDHQLSHGYFLLSDDTFMTFRPRNHVFESTVPAGKDYNYFEGKSLIVGEKVYPRIITDKDMLLSLFSDISGQGGAIGKIEIQLKFPGKTNVNDSDMYKDEITEAYARLKNPDFTLDNQRPYFQYPNGVYVFLMYY